MSDDSHADSEVNSTPPTPLVELDDPFANLFFDRTTDTGVRLLAVAEPVNRASHGYLTAAAALAAFEVALGVAIKMGIEPGLYRAFAAANDAVRAANRRTVSSLRAYAGITAVVIDGDHATIGYIPPGQALILQDGQLYGVPDLATWEPGFMPCSESDEPEPLGFSAVARPRFRRTVIGSGDQFMLGDSAVGRVLANPELQPLKDATESNVVRRVEEGLAASGVDDAYAAWIRCDKAPVVVAIDEARMIEIERLWRSQPSRASKLVPAGYPADTRLRRAEKLDQWHNCLIETSERLLGRRETECLPLESRRRASAPVSAGSLRRYSRRRGTSLTPWFRGWLPRGLSMPHSKPGLGALVAVLLVVASLAVTHNVRDTRAAKQDRFLGAAKTEILKAQSATSREEAGQHIEKANGSLDHAIANGADFDVIDAWRGDLVAVEDRWNGVRRFTGMARIGTIPEALGADEPQLILVGGDLFLIAGGVYLVDEAERRLIPILVPGDYIDTATVKEIVSATADRDKLLVTDGSSLFRLDENRNWTSSPMASSGRSGGWTLVASGYDDGGYYLFDITENQVKRFEVDQLDDEPVDWLSDKAAKHAEHVVDMAVGSDLYLLTTDGTVYGFSHGKDKSKYEISDAGDKASMVGLYSGTESVFLYVVEIDNKNGELIRFDASTQERTLFLAPLSSAEGYDAAAAAAFGETVDFAINEASGVAYFVTATGMWRASLV